MSENLIGFKREQMFMSILQVIIGITDASGMIDGIALLERVCPKSIF